MKNRLPVEHFHFPVEKIKAGYYTDAYFLRTEEILNGDNHHPRVMMQLFTREPVVVCGIDETIALIKTCAHNPENITIHALHDGDEVDPWETLMTIEGDLADFAHLETIYLGFLARQSRIATNVKKHCRYCPEKSQKYFRALPAHCLPGQKTVPELELPAYVLNLSEPTIIILYIFFHKIPFINSI